MAVDEGAGGGGGGRLMWISVVKSSSSGYGGGTRMAGRSSQVIPPPGPPTRPGVFVFCPSPAYTSAVPASNAAAAVTVVSAAQLPSAISRLPASTATAECLTRRDVKTVAIPGLPVTPPSKFKRLKSFMKMTRKERRKKSDRRGCDEGSCHDGVTTDCRPTQRSEHQQHERGRASHREEPPERCSWGNYNNSPTVNYSYGPTGVDHLRQQNVLPLWLEGRHVGVPQSSAYTSRGREVAATDNDGSFETKWDSFRGKNKVHSSGWVGQRPPGWEDVGPSNVSNNTRQYNSNYCPTFGVQNIGSSGTENTQTASAPPYDLIATSPWSEDSATQHYIGGDNLEQLQSSMGNNENFTESFVEDQSCNAYNPNNSESCAEIQQEVISASKRRSEPCTAEEDATSDIVDKHLWASSDSFYCEDFTYFDKKRKYEHNDISVQPRSYSEVQLHKHYSETSLPSSSNTNDEEPTGTCSNSRVTYYNSETQSYTSEEERVPDTPPLNRLSLNESFQDSPTSGSSYTANNNSDGSRTQSNFNLVSEATLPVEHFAHRGNWIQFDRNSIDSLKLDTQAAQGASMRVFLPMNNKSRDSQGTKDPQVSDASGIVSPVTDDHEKPEFCSKEACGGQPPGNYSGRLIRTYSQRGRRMSKRVINSFSRKMSSSDYGKVPEPIAPMYSKAVLTMTSGPGLFEQTSTEDSDTDQMESIRIEEPHKDDDAVFESNVKEAPPPTTSAKPARVGSLRVPRLSAALVRRSVSLNAPKVERDDVPFQRLPDRRPGSFRKAISGLGALARRFRRKSSTSEKEAAAPVIETNKKPPVIVPSQGLHRSGSVGRCTQIPRTPQLPRRAITHMTVALHNPQLHYQV